MASLWNELKRRNVVRVAIAYVIVSWLVLQAVSVLVPLLSLPDSVGRLIFLFLLIGFPIAMVFAWAFELTPEGIKREKDVVRTESVTHVTGRKLDFVIITVLAIAVMFFAVDKYVLAPVAVPQPGVSHEVIATDVQRSIAVLPFVNMSSDPEQEYFSDGLAEELLNLLAKIPDLKVIARTSSFAFKGKNDDLRVIGEALGANTLLEGSVRKSGERVRITAQLIDVADGTHIWSEVYDRNLTDIFAVQDDVASAILDALQIHVGAVPTRGQPTDNPEAYALFLRARVAVNEVEFEQARDILQEAVVLDPSFAEAYEQLAYSHWWLAGFTVAGAEGQTRMMESAARALELNPDLALAKALYQDGVPSNFSWVAEIEGFERVIREQPNNVPALEALSFDLLESGYLAEALEIAQRWVVLDPLSAAAHLRLHEAHLANGRREEAVTAIQVALGIGGTAATGKSALHDLVERRYELAIPKLEEFYRDMTGSDVGWVRELITGGRDPDTGLALLDRRIPEIVAAMPTQYSFYVQQELIGMYLMLGHMDRFAEIVLENSSTEFAWSDADAHIAGGMIYNSSEFVKNPLYIDIAISSGMIDAWEHRGPPDRCDKSSGEWVCR